VAAFDRRSVAGLKARIEGLSKRSLLSYELVILRFALPRVGNNASAAWNEFKCRWTVDGVPSDSDHWTFVIYFGPVTLPLRERLAALASRQTTPSPHTTPGTVKIKEQGGQGSNHRRSLFRWHARER
jgi:hypothetical protein